MKWRRNRRNKKEWYVKYEHLKLKMLKKRAKDAGMSSKYLYKKDIPVCPPAEFHVSYLKHDTDEVGLRGIVRDGGFKNRHYDFVSPGDNVRKLLWWSLAVSDGDVAEAEQKLLEETFPGRTEDQAQQQQPFLAMFTTSPAFSDTSMLGPFRFTFSVETVLEAYSEQFCSGAQPIMRIYETRMYLQEVIHVVLVHSPDDQDVFSEFPLLTDDPNDPKALCVYRDGRFIWRPEAMCETHRYEFINKPDENLLEARQVHGSPPYYVWDHVGIALVVKREQVLKLDQLRENLSLCQKGSATVMRGIKFHSSGEAEALFQSLWPDSGSLKTPLTPSADVDEHEPSD